MYPPSFCDRICYLVGMKLREMFLFFFRFEQQNKLFSYRAHLDRASAQNVREHMAVYGEIDWNGL